MTSAKKECGNSKNTCQMLLISCVISFENVMLLAVFKMEVPGDKSSGNKFQNARKVRMVLSKAFDCIL